MAPAIRTPDTPSIAAFCFAVPGRTKAPIPSKLGPARLPADAAKALATLVPLLGCGEEAAAMAFDALAADEQLSGSSETLAKIAREERVHDALLHQLQAALPVAPGTEKLIASARRFHIRLQAGGPIAHLARIAALDSAVCTILSRLTHDRGIIAQDTAIHAMLRRIRNDEAHHVAISRGFVLNFPASAGLRDAAAAAREALANTLALAGAAFEVLGVDPAALDRRIRTLPDRLLSS